MKNRFAAPITAVILLLTVLGFTASANKPAKPVPSAASAKLAVQTNPQAAPAIQSDEPAPVKSPDASPVKTEAKTQAATDDKANARSAKTSAKSQSKTKTTRIALSPSTKTTKKQPTSRGVSSPPGVSKVISVALSMKGVPYRHGGSTPEGFDCSGFTSYAYKQGAGISLPRTSGGQARIGVGVSRDDLAPGDIVYFNTNGR